MIDAIYDQVELDKLRANAFLYVHGHSAGGTNPSLVEAMSFGLPILAFDISYNKVTTDRKALYFKDEIELAQLIQNLDPEALKVIGLQMKTIAASRYSWNRVCRHYFELIEQAVNGKQKQMVTPLYSKIPRKELLSLEASHLDKIYKFYE